ncbi:MAG: single-stranded-DNA-specific exonuclease RecJ [Candidatus Pacebacteria bacterium]|nr:single-stranded-DNA-specific exonuclease RecJ [Candidatus Paceibacterota bacterium]
MQKRWLVNKKYPKSFEKKFPELSPIVLQLLWDRGLRDQTVIDEFFNPDYESDLHDPYLMKDMEKAIARIFSALEGDEKILVYGDYDVDGVTSSAVLTDTLCELKRVLSGISGKKAKEFLDIYIPDREKEGYGITEKAILEIAKRKPNLIITVDCGVSNVESVDAINELGIEVIVTDHHHVPEKRPEAYAIINPKQPDCKYPFKSLAGVGVAFKLAQGLLVHLQKNYPEKFEKMKPGFEKWLLDLVALGTVADCVDLLGENRTLTQYGLLVLNKTQRVGIKKLLGVAGLETGKSESRAKRQLLDAGHIAFNLAPRLNAAGRMDHANAAYKLLMSENNVEAQELAEKLEKSNQTRQKLTEKMMAEVRVRLDKKKVLPKIVIEKGTDWKVGLVGLVAGKLTEEYCRPFLILNENEDGVCGGSGRSIPAFNLIEAIEKCKDLLTQFGGHSQAAGLKLKKNSLKKFEKMMNGIAEEILTENDLIPSIEIDAEIASEKIDWELLDSLEKFGPFGFANRKPTFLVKNLEVEEIKTVGSDKNHLKACFTTILKNEEIKYFPAIGFRLGHMLDHMPERETGLRWGDKVDVVFQLEVNEWNGNRELQMNVVDVKLCQ